MGYRLPSDTDWVTASWQSHKDRNPPSSEPGTDYGCAYGSRLYAVDSGVVTYVKHSNSGGMGRVVEYRTDSGRDTRSLHMSEVWVNVGQHLRKGDVIGVSGASGNGSDWWYGPHVHQTLWPGVAWGAATIDFEPYVGGDTPPPPDPEPEPEPEPPEEEDDDMPNMKGAYYTRKSDNITVYLLFNEGSGFWVEHTQVDANYNNNIAKNWETGPWAPITDSHAGVLKKALDAIKPKAQPTNFTVDIAEDELESLAEGGPTGQVQQQ